MEKRTCLNCINRQFCFARITINEALLQLNVNVVTNDTPGQADDVLIAMANCCFAYKINQNED